MSQEDRAGNLEVVRKMNADLNRGDWAELEIHPGLEDTRRRFPVLRAAFPDLSLEITTELVDGDQVTTRLTMRGTHRGTFMGQAPTGNSFSADVLAIDTVQGDKIVQHVAIADWLSILGAIGLLHPM